MDDLEVCDEYSIFQPEIFSFLQNGRKFDDGTDEPSQQFFHRCMIYNYNQISSRMLGCKVKVDEYRSAEAQALWVGELERLTKSVDGDDPNHFKLAASLAYWVRRRIVFQEAYEPRSMGQKHFKEFRTRASEVLAFMLGFHICSYFEKASLLKNGSSVAEEIRKIKIEAGYIFDASILMRQKNLSPHALYLIYRGLFLDLSRPDMLSQAEIVALQSKIT